VSIIEDVWRNSISLLIWVGLRVSGPPSIDNRFCLMPEWVSKE